MKARVIVTLKSGVLDPQGKAIEGALRGLAVEGLTSVRQGKVFDIELDGDDRGAARKRLGEACERLLANTIVENYAIEIA
jgi:phosphoribosylformylglycinamidine synthase PurS subunit